MWRCCERRGTQGIGDRLQHGGTPISFVRTRPRQRGRVAPTEKREGTVPTVQQLIRQGRKPKPKKTKTLGLAGSPQRRGRLHACVYDHAQEAEFGAAQGVPRAAHVGHGDHGLYPRGGPQPPRALHRFGSWRAREGSSRRALQGDSRALSTQLASTAAASRGPGTERRRGHKMRRAHQPMYAKSIPDPVYKSLLVSQVINKVLWRGKKGAARRESSMARSRSWSVEPAVIRSRF